MKKSIITTIALLLVSSLMLFSQQKTDVVYLKNGSIVKGVIIENKINEHIRLKTREGSVFLYKYDEIDTLAVEEPESSSRNYAGPAQLEDKTGQVGLGLLLSSVGSGGAIHYQLTENTALEFNALSKGMLLNCAYCFDEITIKTAFMVAGSINQFVHDVYKQHKNKIKRNGVSLKAGHSFGNNEETFVAVSWIQENIKDRSPNHSFLFELGGGIITLKGQDEYWTYPNGNKTSFLLNIKVHWNWYLKKN